MSTEEVADDKLAGAVENNKVPIVTTGDPEAQEEEKPQKEWEKRGEMLALIVNVAMIIWFQSIPLLTMFGHAIANIGHWFPCEEGGRYDLSMTSACVCGYTQGFTRCFAPLSCTVMILFIGRELLQKRLFYGVLRRHGVVQFASNNPLTDPLALAVLVTFAHVILYLIYIVYATSLLSTSTTSKFIQHTGGEYGDVNDAEHLFAGDNYAFQMVVELVTFYALPSTLFVVFFFTGYDIEATLVPLSQYVHDAYDAGEGNQLSNLQILDDAHCRQMVESKAAELLAKANVHEEEFEQVIESYNGWSKEDELGKVYMLQSLWPAYVLLPVEASGESGAKLFRVLWMVFLVTSLIVSTFIMGLLGEYIFLCFRHFAKRELPYIIQSVVVIAMAGLCIFIMSNLIMVHHTARTLKVARKVQ